MRIGNFNVAGIARSNFEPGVNINESTAIFNNTSIDVMYVSSGVNVAVVALRGVVRPKILKRETRRVSNDVLQVEVGSCRVSSAHHMLAGHSVASQAGGLLGGKEGRKAGRIAIFSQVWHFNKRLRRKPDPLVSTKTRTARSRIAEHYRCSLLM
jgi:hypothetical protein